MGSFPMNLFSRVGIALCGRDNAAWAQELGIAERTIRRYENGDMEPPEGVWRELLIHVQRVRDTWAYDQTEEDGWTELADQIKARRSELADQIKARRSLATRLFLRRSGRRS
jgi:ribosome-binding protein aMBF1 (putative translation factor)